VIWYKTKAKSPGVYFFGEGGLALLVNGGAAPHINGSGSGGVRRLWRASAARRRLRWPHEVRARVARRR